MSDDQARSNLLSFLPRGQGRDQPSATASATSGFGGSPPGRMPGAGSWPALWAVAAAHGIELRRSEVIDDSGFTAVALALDGVREPSGRQHDRPADVRAELAALEARLDALLPAALSGAATLGLAREEWLATAARLLWRDTALRAVDGLLDVAAAALALADVHAVTVMPAFLGGRPAQPTTLAHFLGGVIGPLRANRERLVSAFARLDRSPLGAGTLAGEVLAFDRGELADRLGFAGIVPNTLDALASVEDQVELLDSVVSAAAILHRFVREIGVWIRTDPTSFVLDTGWTTLPEPGQPTLVQGARLDALEAALAGIVVEAGAMTSRLRLLAYGPLGAAHAWIFEARGRLDGLLERALAETVAFLREGLVVNRAYLGNRAGRGYKTAGDLAAFLITEEQLDPAAARGIAALVLARLQEANLEVSGITQDMVDGAAMMVIGREVKVEIESLGRYLAPRRFLERRQVAGSPAPAMVREWLTEEHASHDQHRQWLDIRRGHLAERVDAVSAAIAEAASEGDS